MNHTCFPREDHLPDWARRDNQVKKGDRVVCIYIHTYMHAYIHIYWLLKSIDHIEAGVRSDISQYFILLVWEHQKSLNVSGQSSFHNTEATCPTRLRDLILIVSIYVFIRTTRHPTATIFVPHCNFFLYGASASFPSMASTPSPRNHPWSF